MKKDGFVLFTSLIILVVVSIITIGLMIYSHGVLKNTLVILEKSKEYYVNETTSKSIFNISLAFHIKEIDGLNFSSIGSNLRSLLDEWKIYVGKHLPSESENWIEIYTKVLQYNEAKDFLSSTNFTNFLNNMVENGILSKLNFENLKVGIFRYTEPGGTIYELVLVKYKNSFHWANVLKKTLNQFLFVTNSEADEDGDPIYFVSGDVIDGPLYSYDTIHIWHYDESASPPIFKGIVEVGGVDIAEDSIGNPIFENGYSIINDPDDAFVLDEEFANETLNRYRSNLKPIDAINNGDICGVDINLGRDILITSVVENAQTKLTIWYWNRRQGYGWTWIPVYQLSYSNIPDNSGFMNATLVNLDSGEAVNFKFNGVIYSDNDVYISDPDKTSFFGGLLNIVSNGNIYIRGNIVYPFLKKADGFEQNTTKYNELASQHPYDKLNIVSKNNVVMRFYVPENLYITATIYALTGEFLLEDWREVQKDRLHVFGSIIQKQRGIIGAFNPYSGYSSGFKKDYVYDRRLYVGPYPQFTPYMDRKVRVTDVR